ncbi:MAG: bifunctional methylenetetrahydrofolate dehydrogenase/methenyltetrahydrofolate cyclohydrolase FolD [Thermodesulfobacteriota bacterium]|nr:MAG: bifunctional methylenetetrahydrofolate dehydrogenase/methenyltetrahydrofolate cyclohydrolase FolD [Thermodesulfobacteriota bacterium]
MSMASVIDGKEIARGARAKVRDGVEALVSRGGPRPGLAVVLVGQDPASRVYVRNKARACEDVGIRSFQHTLAETVSQEELLKLIRELNDTDEVHGILVQLPLPSHIDEGAVIESIRPEKDVDGFHPYNMGRLLAGTQVLVPCTPLGIMELIDSTGVEISGMDAVVVGRSNIVGKPAALLLLQRNATVTVCHSRTRALADKVRSADILIAAVGREAFVKGDWIKEGAVVIDVGINRTGDGRLVGDVDFGGASERASFITPVPGGVGPMTIAMLMKNTLAAAGMFGALNNGANTGGF